MGLGGPCLAVSRRQRDICESCPESYEERFCREAAPQNTSRGHLTFSVSREHTVQEKLSVSEDALGLDGGGWRLPASCSRLFGWHCPLNARAVPVQTSCEMGPQRASWLQSRTPSGRGILLLVSATTGDNMALSGTPGFPETLQRCLTLPPSSPPGGPSSLSLAGRDQGP